MMSEKEKVDYSLYLVTDRSLSLGRSNLEVIEAAVSGGVTLVQLREKEASTQEFYKEGLRVKDYLEVAHIPLIINDRIDIALALDADGVHLGQDDMPVDVARKIQNRFSPARLPNSVIPTFCPHSGFSLDRQTMLNKSGSLSYSIEDERY